MKKYIIYSALTMFFFPLVMFYPLFFLGLFVPNPLFALIKITGNNASGFGIASIIWLFVGAIIGLILYKFREAYYSKKNLPIPAFGFLGLLLSILIQLSIAFVL